ncbi:LPXTG cell wall anchor domain-containing protein [Leucobacter sp. G161]|uniref:LPXTG cell wall anchor domain-containing protein n=1 Tax=Leucobacter sp. G161 TaxID=663704 RepID=UPI0009F97348
MTGDITLVAGWDEVAVPPTTVPPTTVPPKPVPPQTLEETGGASITSMVVVAGALLALGAGIVLRVRRNRSRA